MECKMVGIFVFKIGIERRKVDLENTPFRRDAARVTIFEIGFDEDFGVR